MVLDNDLASESPTAVAFDDRADVIVVGGGPTGMTAAGDLARAGRSVVVLERWPQINPASRAFATMARTLEVLDARGLADDLLALGSTTPAVHLFAGATVDLTRLRSRYRYGLITPQTNVDQALTRYAEHQGAAIHRGVEVVALDQDTDGVAVSTRPKDASSGDSETHWWANYLVAADGAHSSVRGLLGIEFPGRSVLSSVVLADVRLTAGPTGGGLTLGSTGDCFGFLVPYGTGPAAGWYRSMTWDRHHQLPDTAPIEPAEIQDVLNRAMGRDVGVAEISWHSRFHCDERQIRQYRCGRVFFAGDAAHVHSPMGGQGMNTGIQDAANLAWKLDAVLGGADDRVLDTYHTERHPIGERVLLQSGAMMRGVTLRPRPARWLRDRIAPTTLGFGPIANTIAGSFAGTTLRYRRRRGEHRLVGTLATETPLTGDRLTVLQRTRGFVLIREHGAPPVDIDLPQAVRTDSGPALLVRPDGYIAWAGPSTHSQALRQVWQRWIGSHTPTPHDPPSTRPPRKEAR
ncbi:FAD-dependent oxidoreductase [Nocardia sp. CWNU-33]|uniref:FAD-dependent oxidoreductase n=1 Tax=Nocardia sp. CWNU-33 TaxID=3392117 RepID=UPI00398EE188